MLNRGKRNYNLVVVACTQNHVLMPDSSVAPKLCVLFFRFRYADLSSSEMWHDFSHKQLFCIENDRISYYELLLFIYYFLNKE